MRSKTADLAISQEILVDRFMKKFAKMQRNRLSPFQDLESSGFFRFNDWDLSQRKARDQNDPIEIEPMKVSTSAMDQNIY